MNSEQIAAFRALLAALRPLFRRLPAPRHVREAMARAERALEGP